MTAFRAARGLLAGWALAAGLAQGAAAQPPGPPLLLTPAPTTAAEAAPGETAAPADTSAGPAIAVDTLAPPKPDAMGLVDARGGGFPDDMWRDSNAETVRALIVNLPRRYTTLSARKLAVRFLLSAAVPPVAGGASGSLLEARVFALAEMGAWNDALALTELVAPEKRSPALAHLHLSAQLILGKTDAACGETQRVLSASAAPDPQWQKVQVFCQLAAGQDTPASLSIDVLREEKVDDPAFYWAVSVAQGGTAPPPPAVTKTAGAIDPLVLALLRSSGRLIPADVLAGDDPTTMMVAAQIAAAPTKGPVADLEARLGAVEHAVENGLVDAAVLRNLYLKADAGAPPASTAAIAGTTAQQRAAAYKLAMAQTAPAARAEVIGRVYTLARPKEPRDAGHVMLASLVYGTAVREITASADLDWFAGTAVRILMADASGAEAHGRIQEWLDLVTTLAATAPEAGAVNDALWPVRQVATGGTLAHDRLQMWAAAESDAAPDLALDRRVLLVSLLSALGDGVTLADWESLLADEGAEGQLAAVPAPSAIAWQSLSSAARSRRVGETVALALQMLDGHRVPSSMAQAKAVESLAAVGRGLDARAVATDLALARGL